MKAAAIILSGGKSSRMGTNKALLKINERTNIERIAEQLKAYFEEIILVTNEPTDYQFLGLKTAVDQFPGKGPLAGLHAGLSASDYENNFVAACDMPFLSGKLAQTLVGKIGDYDAAVPIIAGKRQPLFAVFQKRITKQVEQRIEKGELRMTELLEAIQTCYLSENDLQMPNLERAFFNMNNPAEYEKAKKWAQAED
jgi:molybdenum cofactor guanylyltransferase